MLDVPRSPDPITPYRLGDAEIGFYKNEGWLLLPGLLRSDAIRAIRDDILSVLKQLGTKKSELAQASEAAHKLIQSSQYLEGTPLDGLINSPALNALANALLGGESTLYMPFSAVKSACGGGEFHFHQDNNYTQFEDGLHGINIWFALVDMTPDNGCLCIEPRTHIDGTVASENVGQGDHHRRVDYDPEFYLPVRMRAGDAVAFSRLTVHGSGANTTQDPRVAYAVQFHHNDARARWDGQPSRALKNAKRWRTEPVETIGITIEPTEG